jgi:hypothetical protein
MQTVNRSTAPDAIAAQEDFHNSSNSLWGGPVNPDSWRGDSMGRLPEEWRAEIKRSAERGNSPVYAVYSYATPIGWLLQDGTAVVPEVSYSVTTSQHQGLVRRGFAGRRMVTRVDETAEV